MIDGKFYVTVLFSIFLPPLSFQIYNQPDILAFSSPVSICSLFHDIAFSLALTLGNSLWIRHSPRPLVNCHLLLWETVTDFCPVFQAPERAVLSWAFLVCASEVCMVLLQIYWLGERKNSFTWKYSNFLSIDFLGVRILSPAVGGTDFIPKAHLEHLYQLPVFLIQ